LRFVRIVRRAGVPRAFPSVPRTLGERLRRRRLETGLLQREVAVILGVSEFTVLNGELDRTKPQSRLWPKWIAFLGYDRLGESPHVSRPARREIGCKRLYRAAVGPAVSLTGGLERRIRNGAGVTA
jgi:DNA-binding XRE family transcriptional regulator